MMTPFPIPLPVQKGPPFPPPSGIRPNDPLFNHIRDTSDPHKVRDLLAAIGVLRKNEGGTYTPYLPMKADLVNGKVPASQLPEPSHPVTSVNSKTGAVTLGAHDVGALSMREAEAGFTDWACEPAVVNGKTVIIGRTGSAWYPTNEDEGSGAPKVTSGTSLSWTADEWWGGVPLAATRTRLRPTPGQEAAWDEAASAAAAAKEELQFKEWFPGGEARGIADCTAGLNYVFDDAHHTAEVAPFSSDGIVEPNNADKTGRIVIPPYVERNGVKYTVTGIGGYAPQDLPSGATITAIVAPTTVTYVSDFTFFMCFLLASVSLPSVTTVGDEAFNYCNALASVSLPAATTIGDDAFSGITPLTSVSLPAATAIGAQAFYDCTDLASVDFGPTARLSVPTLGPDAFSNLSLHGHTCRIIVPDGQFDDWTADTGWAALTSKGYVFVRHSETEPAKRGDLRYALDAAPRGPDSGTGKYALDDRAANWIQPDGASVTIVFPSPIEGRLRDFEVYVESQNGGTGNVSLTCEGYNASDVLTLGNGAGAVPGIPLDGDTVLFFSEVRKGRFLLKGEEFKTVAQGGN